MSNFNNILSKSDSNENILSIIGDHPQGAGGYHQGWRGEPYLMAHLDYVNDKRQKGNIEELFLHETSHACIDTLNGGERSKV